MLQQLIFLKDFYGSLKEFVWAFQINACACTAAAVVDVAAVAAAAAAAIFSTAAAATVCLLTP